MQNDEPDLPEVEDNNGQQPTTDQGYGSSKPDQEITLDRNAPQTNLAVASKENHPIDMMSDGDLREIDEQAEQDLDPDSGATAREVWEDTRAVSRKVLRLAARALNSSRERAANPLLGQSGEPSS